MQPDTAEGLLANDSDPDAGTNSGLTVSGPTASAQSGQLTINADGSFNYNPAAGFSGADTFTYTVTDADGKTDTATATLNVSNVFWFVNNAAPAGGDGRLNSPVVSHNLC
ncbi:MAG: Ig-like domain-containing protein [Pyrinomonadaceae bacterium]